jgi:hypothetical protein
MDYSRIDVNGIYNVSVFRQYSGHFDNSSRVFEAEREIVFNKEYSYFIPRTYSITFS